MSAFRSAISFTLGFTLGATATLLAGWWWERRNCDMGYKVTWS